MNDWADDIASKLRWNGETPRRVIIAQALRSDRTATIERCYWLAKNGCLVPPDGGAPTVEEADMCDRIAETIRDLDK